MLTGYIPHCGLKEKMKAILKKPWRSPRGKLYPAGTTFIKKNDIKTYDGIGSAWYDFNIPDGAYGMVLIPDKVFRRLTPEEIYLREERKKIIDAHLAATADPFLRKL